MIGTLNKMAVSLGDDGIAQYQLRVGQQTLALNPLIGKTLTLTHTGNIFCCNCGKRTKKSYAQGHCFVCMQKLASCDMCVMKPETCHFEQGSCREPEWGLSHCFVPHYVYLANTSGLKVGITRHTQLPTRWLDQGATQGMPLFKVNSRYLSGLIEVTLAELIADKTNWQAMLKGDNEALDLASLANTLLPQIQQRINELDSNAKFAIEPLTAQITSIQYPVSEFPTKIKSHNFDKAADVSGTLLGIKGQYLMFDTGVINIRKFTSYEVSVSQ
ncbi:DUF2797 domain-containing protein [Shewanella avicenniae]|uniref:DUF2797 domain-containing protein n=1 Tax=Shewanella avicenniae TaxID=2814294 RepID=A0ABX7QTY1_9GAMM|nr:DUF2797 domain-containing protein [Shewanella avicenniae]QSX34947.1 DUF2797 domain-containing protein [Shewanella avicenniae]